MKSNKIKLITLISIVFFISIFSFVHAEGPDLQVNIPQITWSDNAEYWIGDYILAVYKYAITFVGILATVIMMYGGLKWLTSGGSSDKISDARAWIGASLGGLILVLSSVLILSIVNPELVKIKPIGLTRIDDNLILPTMDPNLETQLEKWVEIPNEKNCRDILGDGWYGSYRCSETGKTEGASCCIKDLDEAPWVEKCKEECGYDNQGKIKGSYNANTRKCDCYGDETHLECVEHQILNAPSEYKCEKVSGPGVDRCSNDGDCVDAHLGCCLYNPFNPFVAITCDNLTFYACSQKDEYQWKGNTYKCEGDGCVLKY